MSRAVKWAIATSSGTTIPLSGGIDGTWAPHESLSQVGYRVNEVLFGQSKAAVGRTSDVTGSMVIEETTVSKVSFGPVATDDHGELEFLVTCTKNPG